MSKRNYKQYFRNEDTPRCIPRRTIFRQIRKTKLLERFQAGKHVQKLAPIIDDEVTFSEDVNCHQSESESESDSESSIGKDEKTPYQLLFSNGRISKDESIRLIYCFIIRHKLSKSAVADLLLLLNFHLPSDVSIPSSAFLLEKCIQPDFSVATRCFYCPNCESAVETDNQVCERCDVSILKMDLLKNGKFFIMFNIKSCLLKLLELPDVRKSLASQLKNRSANSNKIEDIMDGQCYKQLQMGGFDFSCSINTDGVNIFNSSKFSIWPILLSVNELEYKVRRKHTLLVGLWFGSNKPSFETFLRPLVDQCNAISLGGIQWEFNGVCIDSKVFFPIVAADSVARCALQGIKQFNGQYGCPWCLTKGETLHQDGGKHKWIYPPGDARKRTKETFIEHLKNLKNNLDNNKNEETFGVKAASQFLLLQKFDIVNGFVFDYMHTCLLGVVRTFASRWFDSKFHDKDFYIGTKQSQINDAFTRCKVPYEVNRVTRDLNDMAFWKANEWKTWMLICIPLLNDFLKRPYLKHFAKFVHAVTILTSNSVYIQDIDYAEELLHDFCYNAGNLYGMDICTFNLHILLHASDCVRNWGPLWCYSLFQFENTNGVLTNYFSGTSQVCMQILKKVLLIQQVKCLGTFGFNNENAKKFFISLIDNHRYSLKASKYGDVTFLGPKRKYLLNELEKDKLKRQGIDSVTFSWSYKHFIVNGKKYCTSKHDTAKRNNSIIKVNSQVYILLKCMVIKHEGNDVPILFARKLTAVPMFGINTVLKIVRISEGISILSLSLVESGRFVCSFGAGGTKLLYLAELSNSKETE